MDNQLNSNVNQKKRSPLLMPIILILLLVAITMLYRYLHQDKKGDNGIETTSQTATEYGTSSHSIFSPSRIIDFVDKNEDYIAGECKKMQFDYSFSNDKSSFFYTYSRYDRNNNKNTIEFISTWKDYPNRLNYCFSNEENYADFISKIIALNPTTLNPNQHDKFYTDSTHYLVKDCVFIPIGFKKDYNGFCVMAIRRDNIIVALKDTLKKSNIESVELNSNSNEKIFFVKVERAIIYKYPSEYENTSMFLEKGKKVIYVSTDGEFIYCKYENDEGVPISGYIKISDVGKAN